MRKKFTYSTRPQLALSNECTGCGACANICPNDAIKMEPDAEGFIFPRIDPARCINCDRCEDACPVLHPAYPNRTRPRVYAMMANDAERQKSSTGAFAPELAKWVLNENGVVYGAAWGHDWHVDITRIDGFENLDRIRGSKYLQSRGLDAYRKALRDLKNGKWVLYTGTPCQIAGLYGFLGRRDFNKLITFEVICHGWPSYKVFHKYLEDNFDIANIKEISFRDKKPFGWIAGMNIIFRDGGEFHEHADKNIFFNAFNPILCMNRACGVCKFSRLPRQADFSGGDFWGVKEYDPELSDGLGTSFILVNNNHHLNVIRALAPAFKLWEEIPISAPARINKTIFQPFKAHSGRKHFFSSLGIKDFNKLVRDSLAHHYDVGIAGLWYGLNYGSILTYYALYCLIRELGHDPVMLPKPAGLWTENYNDPNSIAQKFIWKHCNVFLPYKDMAAYVNVNNLCAAFVVGSDVVWNYDICGKQSGHFFFLDFVGQGKKKVSFASSFGNSLSGPKDYQQKCLDLLGGFTALSCREIYGQQLLNERFPEKNVAAVLDPVFVCDKNEFIARARESGLKIDGKYCFSYILNKGMLEKKIKLMQSIRDIYGYANIKCANPNLSDFNLVCDAYGIDKRIKYTVEDWLKLMIDCDYYFGDSYHGLCFSLLFHKKFIIVYSANQLNASFQRFSSLLKITGLEERLISSEEDINKINQIIAKDIDWGKIDYILGDLRQFSRQWLANALK